LGLTEIYLRHQGVSTASAALILTLIVIINTGNITVTSAGGEAVILKPIEDGYIDSLQPSVNFAGANLAVEYFNFKPQSRQRWSFLLFNLTSIPQNNTIESAELYLYTLETHGALRVGAFRSLDISWNERDLYWTPAREASVSRTSNSTQQITNVAWYHFNVKGEVQDSLKTKRLTLVIRPDYSSGFEYAAGAVFSSNDQPGRSNAPRLEIIYATDTSRPSKQRTAIILDTNSSRTGVGADIKIFGVLQSDGAFLNDKPVVIEYSFDTSDWKAISTVKTDEDGTFIITWRTERAGSFQIRARFPGNENYHATESLTQLQVESIQVGQINLAYVLTVVVAVAGGSFLLWNAIRKRHRIKFKSQTGLLEATVLEPKPVEPEPRPPESAIEVISERVSTGHNGLDRLLRGGLSRNYATVLTSPSCDEVDLLTHRFLETGLQGGNSVLYITARLGREPELAEKYPTFYYMVCNPQTDSSRPDMPNIYTTRGLDSLTEINLTAARALAAMDRAGKEKVIFTDLVSDILLQHGPTATRQWLFDFISRMKSKYVTLFVALNSKMHSKEDLEALLDLFDGQIDLWDEKTDAGSRKFVRVRRMYRERYSDESLPIEKSDFL